MEFLVWHYSEGVRFYIKRWFSAITYISHYFSLPLLITSLFSPWKRLIVVPDGNGGFNPRKSFENASFNLVSRFIGAIVRIVLFITGDLFLILVAVSGFVGLLLWLLLPFLGYPVYSKFQSQPKLFAKKLVESLRTSNNIALTLFSTEAGKFVLKHAGLTFEDVNSFTYSPLPNDFSPKGFVDIIDFYGKAGVWPEQFLRSKGLVLSDLVDAGVWWDRQRLHESQVDAKVESYGRPGIGLELLFGYTPTLNQYSIDLGVPQPFSKNLIGRGNAVSRIQRALSSGSSVIVLGQPGVGKKTVVLEFARRAFLGQLGRELSYRRVMEFDFNFLLSTSIDLNQKKLKLNQVLAEAAGAGNIIMVLRDLHRITNQQLEGLDFTDLLEKFLEKKELKIVAISGNSDYEKFISQNLRLRKFFETVEVTEPTHEEAKQIIFEAAGDWEKSRDITITTQALRVTIVSCERYISETPFPEKAIELLDSTVTFVLEGGRQIILPDDINQVLGEKTGIPVARIGEHERELLGNLEEIIHKNLINQEHAVSLIGKSLRARSVGVKEDTKPIGSFLFLGPTGVGKTQTAKVLANVYFGSEKQILRFDMAEFAGNEGLSRLIGSQASNQPGILTTSIKNRPASLLLLDEIEKAPPEIYNLLLTLLDEGYITDAFGRKVDCRNLFVIATSNAAAELIREKVYEEISGDDLQNVVVDYIQREHIFSPEFINRFDGVVVFEPLTQKHLIEVARLMFADLQKVLESKNIKLEITDELCAKLAQDGFDPAFGARPMRRVIDLTIGDLLGRAILNGELKDGDKIKIVPGSEKLSYSIAKF